MKHLIDIFAIIGLVASASILMLQKVENKISYTMPERTFLKEKGYSDKQVNGILNNMTKNHKTLEFDTE